MGERLTDTEFAAWAVSKLFPSDSWTEDPMGGKIWLGEKLFNPRIDANDALALAEAWCAKVSTRRVFIDIYHNGNCEVLLCDEVGEENESCTAPTFPAAICTAVYAAEGGES